MNHFEGEEFQHVLRVCKACMQKVLGCSYAEFMYNVHIDQPPITHTNVKTEEQTYRNVAGYDVTLTTRIETTKTMRALVHVPDEDIVFVSDSRVIDKVLNAILATKEDEEKNETACD
jgi:hypothetical protein